MHANGISTISSSVRCCWSSLITLLFSSPSLYVLCKGGVEYKYGRWSEIAENSLTPKVHGPYLKAEGQARLALGFDVNLHCDIGAIASGIEILEVDTVTTVTPKVVTTVSGAA